ncbi:hypothetical protein HN747_02265 [archaeon]|jgi:hypothetical protein|nr:hypothetical protein [archaeon]
MGEKRGQMTIFVIFGILIVFSIVAWFYFSSSNLFTSSDDQPVIQEITTSAREFVKECVGLQLEDAIDEISNRGGYGYDKNPSLTYKFQNISYLCHTLNYDENCVNLEPVLMGSVDTEIESYLSSGVESCFNDLLESYKRYNPVVENTKLDIIILPGKIIADIEKNIEITEESTEIRFNDFSFEIVSPLYVFLNIAIKILNEEATCDCAEATCNSDYSDLDTINRGFTVSRFVSNSGDKVYTIKYSRTGDEFNFAVRNCIDNI